MKPAIPAASGRTPYAERPEVITRHCTCPVDWEGEREIWFIPDPDGTRTHVYATDPDCPLHGDNAEGAPY